MVTDDACLESLLLICACVSKRQSPSKLDLDATCFDAKMMSILQARIVACLSDPTLAPSFIQYFSAALCEPHAGLWDTPEISSCKQLKFQLLAGLCIYPF